MKKWKHVDEHIFEKFPIFSAKKSIRENPITGKPHTFFLMEGLDWVNVIAITKKQEIVLIRQHRHGIDETTLEIPGGCIDPGEKPVETALRELREETGYHSKSIEPLGMVHANPAMQSMKAFTFLVKEAEKFAEQELESGEDIEVVLIPFDEVFNLVTDGTITHALVVAALGLYRIKCG